MESQNFRLRADAKAILDAAIQAANPQKAVSNHVALKDNELILSDNTSLNLAKFNRIFVVGAGKATAGMAKAVEEILGNRITEGIICVKYGHQLPLTIIKTIQAAHPVPDSAGERAAEKIIELLSQADEKDLVISLISGGGSALLPLCRKPVTLEEKQKLTLKLLAVEADIHEINIIRKHISLTKGGNLMKFAYPARVINLVLSDVIGDDLDIIASGPFVPDRSTFGDAYEILKKYNLLESTADSIEEVILGGLNGKVPETPKPGDSIFDRVTNIIIGSNILSLYSAHSRAVELGYNTLILSSSIQGDTSQAALFHAAIAREIRATGNPVPAPACILSGGETTVRVMGQGVGGRNQEFVLALAKVASKIKGCLFLSAGTDGTDGPTEAAGAIVDETTLSRALEKGLDPDIFLRNNDSNSFFKALNDLVVTGPTGTNVMDIRIVLLGAYSGAQRS